MPPALSDEAHPSQQAARPSSQLDAPLQTNSKSAEQQVSSESRKQAPSSSSSGVRVCSSVSGASVVPQQSSALAAKTSRSRILLINYVDPDETRNPAKDVRQQKLVFEPQKTWATVLRGLQKVEKVEDVFRCFKGPMDREGNYTEPNAFFQGRHSREKLEWTDALAKMEEGSAWAADRECKEKEKNGKTTIEDRRLVELLLFSQVEEKRQVAETFVERAEGPVPQDEGAANVSKNHSSDFVSCANSTERLVSMISPAGAAVPATGGSTENQVEKNADEDVPGECAAMADVLSPGRDFSQPAGVELNVASRGSGGHEEPQADRAAPVVIDLESGAEDVDAEPVIGGSLHLDLAPPAVPKPSPPHPSADDDSNFHPTPAADPMMNDYESLAAESKVEGSLLEGHPAGEDAAVAEPEDDAGRAESGMEAAPGGEEVVDHRASAPGPGDVEIEVEAAPATRLDAEILDCDRMEVDGEHFGANHEDDEDAELADDGAAVAGDVDVEMEVADEAEHGGEGDPAAAAAAAASQNFASGDAPGEQGDMEMLGGARSSKTSNKRQPLLPAEGEDEDGGEENIAGGLVGSSALGSGGTKTRMKNRRKNGDNRLELDDADLGEELFGENGDEGANGLEPEGDGEPAHANAASSSKVAAAGSNGKKAPKAAVAPGKKPAAKRGANKMKRKSSEGGTNAALVVAEEDLSQQERDLLSQKKFRCPVDGCKDKHAREVGYTSYAGLVKHLTDKHYELMTDAKLLKAGCAWTKCEEVKNGAAKGWAVRVSLVREAKTGVGFKIQWSIKSKAGEVFTSWASKVMKAVDDEAEGKVREFLTQELKPKLERQCKAEKARLEAQQQAEAQRQDGAERLRKVYAETLEKHGERAARAQERYFTLKDQDSGQLAQQFLDHPEAAVARLAPEVKQKGITGRSLLNWFSKKDNLLDNELVSDTIFSSGANGCSADIIASADLVLREFLDWPRSLGNGVENTPLMERLRKLKPLPLDGSEFAVLARKNSAVLVSLVEDTQVTQVPPLIELGKAGAKKKTVVGRGGVPNNKATVKLVTGNPEVDVSISRGHFSIFFEKEKDGLDGRWYLEDDSLAGTCVDKKRVDTKQRPFKLYDGCEISIGSEADQTLRKCQKVFKYKFRIL
mmetsp:Transcript_27829/g.70317  ORF Transcript_27829/g.70317 Transcript_27829/m.70317 type:complete len:1137 (-) Transcript_27829:222-3632(-)|eukprot:CAMPEP_0178984424 /NCGR_PEP_ID=MMETSP0795-20121207/1596_1 /TAXON_ID=88552 /ORGANISM="Amoebophrya sp., Strain Ameob2" /LENGTH=1136 /DNA_ID=CAMNT_0020675283 /DNA_START=109 /DNA_END=3519 /DNA_ORIENTATION=+